MIRSLLLFRRAVAGRSVALVCLFGVALSHTSALFADDDLADQERAVRADFAKKLNVLADKCVELQLPEQAQTTRSWLAEQDPNRQYLFAPTGADPTKPTEDAATIVQQWHRGFMRQRAEFAKQLFALARANAEAGGGTRAYQLLHEVLWHDPQHSDARRALAPDLSFAERIARRAGTRTHRDFGWRPRKYWQIESAHYRITTSHSAEAGVELARKLELLHTVWRQVFFRYWSASESLAERIAGGNARLGTRKKMDVVLFRDRDEYIEQLQRHEPQIAMSLGYYMYGRQTAFFYAGDDSIEPTWFHEATHQLFQELGEAVDNVGDSSNFWLVEGIAVYMESLVAFDGYCTLGGFDADRLQYARARALSGQFYMPLAEMVALGREALQKHEEIGRIYTQAAGIVHYLMNGDHGANRESLIDFVTLLYLARARSDSLTRLSGKGLDELDKGYLAYLAVRDDDLKYVNPPQHRRNLCLVRSDVSDVGIKLLRGSTQLEWLDLSFTEITDAAIANFKDATSLRQLNLEGTKVGDATLKSIAEFNDIEELDLSNTRVTDAGLANLSRLTKLKILWLTNTAVSNAGLVNLERLKQLEFLDVSGTDVTAERFKQLQAKLPKLNRDQ